MDNEQGAQTPDHPPFPVTSFGAATHLVLGQDDETTWHVVLSTTLELMRTACYARMLGTAPLQKPYVQLVVTYYDHESGIPQVPAGRICERCHKNAVAAAAHKLVTLLKTLGNPAGARADLVAVADTLGDFDIE